MITSHLFYDVASPNKYTLNQQITTASYADALRYDFCQSSHL